MITVLIPSHSYQVAAQSCSEIYEQRTSVTETLRSNTAGGKICDQRVDHFGLMSPAR